MAVSRIADSNYSVPQLVYLLALLVLLSLVENQNHTQEALHNFSICLHKLI